MSALAALQADFQDYLLRGQTAVAARIEASERVPAQVRLAIYGEAYRGRLIDALASNYPALAELLDADFRELGERYVASHDSHYCNIRWYGDELAQFLGTEERYASTPLLA
ncbi:MAG TPA: DNA-binding domain-containing protein, partial [Steroidobacteraceae bacterium]|nr:DNA-binding domain-containing protein [Steroidobacteraceae bacterium]